MDTYKISEFARLSGVTPRTLQYYDKIGVVSASKRTEKGYRLYTRKDLLRLQLIRTLNWMGFSLREAGDILDKDGVNIKALLQKQREVFIDRGKQIAQAIKCLDRMIPLVDDQANEIEPSSISAILQAVSTEHSREWFKEYLSENDYSELSRQSDSVKEFAPLISSIFEALQDAYSKKCPPESEEVQSLIGQMKEITAKMRNKVTITDTMRSSFRNAYQDRSIMSPLMQLDEGFNGFFAKALEFDASEVE